MRSFTIIKRFRCYMAKDVDLDADSVGSVAGRDVHIHQGGPMTSSLSSNEYLTQRLDQLMSTVYEIKADVATIRERSATVDRLNGRVETLERTMILMQDGMPTTSGIPSTVIYVMVIGAIISLILMAILTYQINLPG